MGWPNVDRMLAQMTSRQLYEWELMYTRWHMLDTPHARADVSAAIVAQTVANVHSKKPISLDKFLPTFTDGEPEPQSPDALRDKMLAYANRTKKGTPRGGVQQAPS